MTSKIKLKTKLLLQISILILVFLMLVASLITTYYSKADSLKELNTSVLLATKISQLVHSTQKERGYSSGYVTSNGLKFKEELFIQREITDKKILILHTFLAISNDKYRKNIKKALSYIEILQKRRKNIDSLSINNTQVISFYSDMNDKFLNIIVELSKYSQIPKITQNLIAYNNFLYAKENAGIERAQGTAILTQNYFTGTQRIYFTNLVNAQNLYLKIFLNYSSKESKAFYYNITKHKDFKSVNSIRHIILMKENNFNIDVQVWFKAITSKIDKLVIVDNFLEKEILANINNELERTYTLFSLFTFLNFLGIMIFIGTIILILRLTESERRLKQINDKYIISSITDTKGKIIKVSDAFCEISQYTREELLGKPHNIIRHPDMPKSAFENLWNTIQAGKHWQGKVKNLKKDGSYYWVYANIEPLFDKKGNIEAYAAVRLDITDSIQLREELQKSQEKDKAMLQQSKLAQMGEMIAMIAHQWRQPLTAISSISSDLYMKIMLKNYDESYFNLKLEKIDDLSQHLSKTIDDFRGFYKEDKEKIEIKFCDIVNGALSIVASSIETKNIKLITEFTCQKKISTYPNELRQVILNFIKNAEDILIEKKITNAYIHIKTFDKDRFSYLEVKDNADGVPLDIIDKIFDPYFSTKTQKDGTGLGLYMSKTIIEDHCEGMISVFNDNSGAIFQIKIPNIEEE
ncbi:MAG: hypothetical protein DRG78_19180 [Epsilonproteobacteria bacterium]|nr:MAG: hypothetical protein DRG78_19180 [Campylobacterota bacterium]